MHALKKRSGMNLLLNLMLQRYFDLQIILSYPNYHKHEFKKYPRVLNCQTLLTQVLDNGVTWKSWRLFERANSTQQARESVSRSERETYPDFLDTSTGN